MYSTVYTVGHFIVWAVDVWIMFIKGRHLTNVSVETSQYIHAK